MLADGFNRMGQVAILRVDGSGQGPEGYDLFHWEDASRHSRLVPEGAASRELEIHSRPEDAEEIGRYDEAGVYRPLKTAPNLRRGWLLRVADLPGLRLALECFYPGRLGAFLTWRKNRLPVTSLRGTLNRQTGMYRITQKITDEQAVALVGRFCRSDGGCARTILWRLAGGEDAPPLESLPGSKFDPACDQIAAFSEKGQESATGKCFPMLCQEACNLLVAEARTVVKSARSAG